MGINNKWIVGDEILLKMKSKESKVQAEFLMILVLLMESRFLGFRIQFSNIWGFFRCFLSSEIKDLAGVFICILVSAGVLGLRNQIFGPSQTQSKTDERLMDYVSLSFILSYLLSQDSFSMSRT